MSADDFERTLLFDAFDMEHAGMIAAGLATRWPEESQAERQEIDETVRAILAARMTRNQKG